MELNKAIEKLNNLIKNANVEDMDMNDIFGGEHIEAIDTVLEELNNRIPISEIEKILEAVKRQREKEIKELGMSLRGSAVDILEGIVKNYRR